MAGQNSPYVRVPFFDERGPGVGVDQSLQERLDEIFQKENNIERINIGFKKVGGEKLDRDQVLQWRRETRKDRALEKAAREETLTVDLGKVRQEWIESGAVFEDIYKSAELYGIYEDLFRHGYFYPCVDLNIAFSLENDMMAPVYRGNIIKPGEAGTQPEVSWRSKDDDLWTLVLTAPDSHLVEEGAEYLHWMVTNIRGSDLNSGEEIANYLQPFPPFGTGFHRFAFVLYKQETRINLGVISKPEDTVELAKRTFNTFDFYSEHQENLTPAGLAFFQSDYEPSLRDFFHNVLNMKEPRYEYEFPLPFIKPWNQFFEMNKAKGFNEFMDRHRDPKDIEKEVLIKKLKHTHPFKGDTREFMDYPEAHADDLLEVFPGPVGEKSLNPRQSYKIPSWRRHAILREQSQDGYFKSTKHSDLRRDPQLVE
ncbi:39S ribosomal protein L38, mitochondrial isoform X3 [Eurytemora carolleeae]|nr:39S ribosomal protein L38, mitochondrial isoform X3 [Eurytemora carolleeae]|eukprot:XP_023320347.1 39S ribosomal protein L38, mitochondrial-like isoform X3 [Eurytemora affinis]